MKKQIYKNAFIRRFKNVTLNFTFFMIYMIHKILVLFKNHLTYLKDNIFEFFFKKYNQ